MNAPTFEAELNAIRSIYESLKPFAIHERDRLLRMVQDRLARERTPAGLMPRVTVQDAVPPPIPFGEVRKR
jgi:hypothetical protein